MIPAKQYIKMCDCPEIQNGRIAKVGDRTNYGTVIYISYKLNCKILVWDNNICKTIWYKKEDLIFTPRQGQLQDMWISLCVESHPISKMIWSFNDWYFEDEPQFNSMKQLWLAFVMWKLYKKKWNGEKWVR